MRKNSSPRLPEFLSAALVALPLSLPSMFWSRPLAAAPSLVWLQFASAAPLCIPLREKPQWEESAASSTPMEYHICDITCDIIWYTFCQLAKPPWQLYHFVLINPRVARLISISMIAAHWDLRAVYSKISSITSQFCASVTGSQSVKEKTSDGPSSTR